MKAKLYSTNTPTNNGYASEGPTCDTNSQCRRRLRSKTLSHSRRDSFTAGVFSRWNVKYLLVLPLLYILALIMCVGQFSAFLAQTTYPVAVYKSHKLFQKLWPHIQADNSTAMQLSSVWRYKRKLKVRRPCSNSTYKPNFPIVTEPSGHIGYLLVEANGGLNQQRSAICNAVAVAGLLNTVLVIPYFDLNSVWMDPSVFADIYDEDHFIKTLDGYVKVVTKLPDDLMERYQHNITNIPNLRVPAWASANYYLGEVYPVLRQQGVVRIAPFANRLAMNVPSHIQLLRCLANYKALKFSSSISDLAQKMVNRMIDKSSQTGGKYVSVHLRFEEDMVAFSCCVYDGGDSEKFEMDSFRERWWKNKFKKKDRIIIPGYNRINGQCPLTPLEVGMMLRGMGFESNTSIYLASGKLYQAERYLAPMLKMFPLIYSKESLATPDELAPFKGYSSRLAALDYTVCLLSEVFVTTHGGNFPHFLMGHRRFLFDGHAKTIRPDKRKLVVLLQDMEISWTAFKGQMEAMLTESDRKGMMVPRVKKINRKTSIYMYPLPECGCLQYHNSTLGSGHPVNFRDALIESIR
ncbi:hypothetical protein K2173_028552 [Erythroxylum novogranatense]|uniref:O-fucosyltransferase family protein n=1 Tax=Erythroxylum novogranatense TaxID=1862640 RepID=A0AAV8U4Y9_9ROSI|nr:hypothetical protein K2173_028552 [Erythroxylum novogranatense]